VKAARGQLVSAAPPPLRLSISSHREARALHKPNRHPGLPVMFPPAEEAQEASVRPLLWLGYHPWLGQAADLGERKRTERQRSGPFSTDQLPIALSFTRSAHSFAQSAHSYQENDY
jgi:hypothetical protein